MDRFAKLGLTFLLISCTLTLNNAQDPCVKKGPCTCVFSNGTGIDLTPVAKTVFFSAQSVYEEKKDGQQLETSTYYYHPCYDAMPPVNSSGINDSCNQSLAICRYVYTYTQNTSTGLYKKDSGVANFIGKANDSTFSINGDAIIYENLPSITTVLLVCAETEDTLHVQSLLDPNQIVLSFYSRSACIKKLNLPDESGRSFGSTLLIIFFSVSIFYLVLGVCTKKFLMGATGIEVIPNLAFWTDLPNLVKDGWAFALAGFKLPVRGAGPAMSPDPNSYDSI